MVRFTPIVKLGNSISPGHRDNTLRFWTSRVTEIKRRSKEMKSVHRGGYPLSTPVTSVRFDAAENQKITAATIAFIFGSAIVFAVVLYGLQITPPSTPHTVINHKPPAHIPTSPGFSMSPLSVVSDAPQYVEPPPFRTERNMVEKARKKLTAPLPSAPPGAPPAANTSNISDNPY